MLAASMLAGGTAAPALAQQLAAADASSEGADAIIVTATRRSTSLADVPINIAAVGAEQIKNERIDDIRDLAGFTPGVTILDTGPRSAGNIVLRGLSADDTSDFGANGNSAVAIYMGEVPLYQDFKLLDLQRVEVLLGPQGTLYGAGTLAGAIRYIPNRPDATEGAYTLDAHIRGTSRAQSSQLGINGDFTVNVPIVADHIALRSTAGYYFDPGFIDYPFLLNNPGTSLPQPGGAFNENVTAQQYSDNFHRAKDVNFDRTWTTRNTLLLQANENLKAYLTFAFQQTKTDGRQSVAPSAYVPGNVLGAGPYEGSWRYLEPSDRRAYLYSAELEANLWDIAQLVSSTAFTLQNNNRIEDNTDLLLDLNYGYEAFPAFSSYAKNHNRNTQFTQELRLVSSHGGPISWTLGGFYNDVRNEGDRQEYVPGYAAFIGSPRIDNLEYISFFNNTNKEKAVFGEATLKLGKFQLTGGLRYYGYDATAEGGTDLPLFGGGLVRTPYPLIQFAPSRIGTGTSSASGLVYKANASYKFREGLLVYATYSTGYRIGGPNTVAPCILPLNPNQQNVCALPNELFYGPDKTYNKEIGIRGSFFDGRLTINLDGYHIVWKNLQVGSQTINGAVGILTNAGAAISKGIEFSGQARVTDKLTIAATYSYDDAHLTQDAPLLVAGVYDAFAGDRLPGSQKHQGSLIATYTQPLADENALVLNWAANYHGDVFSRVGNRGNGQTIPDYWMNRASATYKTPKYEISLFADNIFNVYAITAVGNDISKIGVQNMDYGISRRYYSFSITTPRTLGIEARIHFR